MIKMDVLCTLATWSIFRDSEVEMRRKMIEEDLVECVIGWTKSIYNSYGLSFINYQ